MTWTPGADGNPIGNPVYPPLPIRVVDQIAPTLRFRRLKRWLRARQMAFDEWAASGVPFAIEDGAPGVWPPANLVSGALNIIPGPNSSGGFVHGEYAGASDYGYAQIIIYKGQDTSTMRYLIGHEAGHALGFWHGGTGIMSSPTEGLHPNAEELEALGSYYLQAH